MPNTSTSIGVLRAVVSLMFCYDFFTIETLHECLYVVDMFQLTRITRVKLGLYQEAG